MSKYNTSSIKVPMSVQLQVQDSIKQIKNLRDVMQEEFSHVDPTSSLNKQLTKLMTKVQQGFANIDATNLGTDLFDEAELKQVVSYVNQINTSLQMMRVHGSSASAKQLGLDTTAIEAARKAYKDLNSEYQRYLKSSVAVMKPKELSRFESHKKDTGFKSGQTYEQNIGNLTEARNRAQAEIDSLNTEESIQKRREAEARLEEAKRVHEQALEKYNSAKQASQDAQDEVTRQNKLQEKANIAARFKNIPWTKKGRDKAAVIADYKAEVGKIATKNGNFSKEGIPMAKIVAEWLGYSSEEIDALLKNRASDVVTQLQKELEIAMSTKLTTFTNKVKGASDAYNPETHVRAEAIKNAAVESEAIAKGEVVSANTALQNAQATYTRAFEMYNNTSELLKEINEQIDLLKELDAKFKSDAKSKYESRLNDAEKAIKQTEEDSVAGTRERLKNTGEQIATTAKGASNTSRTFTRQNQENARIQAEAEAARKKAEADAAAEAARQQHEIDSFKQNLQNSIKQWMSAQQIVNLIKDGVRQAWQDIQGLDKAMTNIAVVTDMSVSDLWGKIDQYMAIAQDYGVTTQGVYEVSQLYYQQGLSTSEVMAATTETLKMARIAGMDYAEAADAMTVAIRAFKMEMSDAQVITDVYSKVAATTASDSEELAIAMSKTASSAESVGSSFENTTAMLAVMIETTRESAQNLGSALKSIISRYGEMKTGLTVDSEGEAIDYNKVDTALKSIGISIKDAQGQFRNFDEVIFELSEKWDTLDKNTQRYIATIMAGNRQQSRFIALVDSGERLKEVMDIAQNSEDAGLLQYAKTLDSLDTKLNALSTSFQQFYMKIIDGDTFKGLIDLLTIVLNGLNKIGTKTTILTSITLVKAIKTFSSFILGNFSGLFAEIRKNYKQLQDDLTLLARKGHQERVDIENGNDSEVQDTEESDDIDIPDAELDEKISSRINKLNIVGSVASMIGVGLTGAGHENLGSLATGIGNTLSATGTGAQVGAAIGTLFGPAGTAAGAAIGGLVVGGFTAAVSTLDFVEVLSKKLEYDIEKAKKKAEEKNLKRAEAVDEERNLKSTIENLKKLQAARYESAEAEQAYIDASKEALAAFPALEAQFSSSGDIWIDVLNNTKNSEELLAQAREKTRKATLEAAAAERDQAVKEQEKAQADLENLLQWAKNGVMSAVSVVSGESWSEDSMEVRKLLQEASSLEEILSVFSKLGYTPEEIENAKNIVATEIRKSDPLKYAKKTSAETFQIYAGEINTATAEVADKNKKLVGIDRSSILAYLENKEKLSNTQKDILTDWLYQNKTDDDFSEGNFIPTNSKLLNGIAEYESAFENYEEKELKVFEDAVAAFNKGKIAPLELGKIITNFFNGQVPEVVYEWFTKQGQDFKEQVENFNTTLFNGKDQVYTQLYEIPIGFHNIISDYSNWLTANVKSDTIKLDEKTATDSLNSLLNNLANASEKELALLGDADLTSIVGVQTFVDNLEKAKVNEKRIEAWKNFTPAVINFTTEWAAFNETATSQLHVFSEKLSKAQSGMDLEEATKFASQLGIGLNEFDVENGKFVLKDITALEEKYLRPIKELREKIEEEGKGNPEAEKLAKETTEILDKYENSLYVNFYITTGQFAKAAEKINASLDDNAKLTEDELKQLEQIFKTGIVPEDISPRILTAINPYKETITNSIVDNFVNVWSGIASAFGTDKLFTATDVNREIYQNLAALGIFSSQGGDLYQLNKNLSEDDLRIGLQGITDVKERNKIYQQWNDYKNKTTEALEQLFTGTGKVDYAFVNELASDLNRDAADFIEKYFLKQADGTYRANKAFWDNLSTILGSSYANEQISEIINKIWTNELQQDLKKKDFLQGLSKDATIEDLLEAQDQGWLTITDTMMASIKVGMTSVYEELEKAFADDDNFKIGQTLQTEEITTSLNDSINSLLSDLTSASVEDLRDLYHKATNLEANSELTQSYYDAIVEAKNGNIELLRTYILEIACQASLNDISIDVEKINRTLATAQQELSSILIGGLEAAIEGTLSADNMATLSKELRIDIQHYADSTIDGYKVSAEGLLKIGTEMVQKYGNTYDVAKKLSELFIGEGGIYKGYRDIVKAAEELNKKIEDAADSNEKTTAEYRKQKKLLTEMAKIAMFNGEDPLFKFMDQDPTKGYGLSAESMAESIDKVKDAFESIGKKENISSSEFYNMMDFMYDQLGDWDSFASALGISDATLAKLEVSTKEGADIYSSFVNAIVSKSKELGEVDADVLIGLGLSAEKMAGGMSKSLKEVADDQIAQLNALRETLVAMKSMEELGNIELGLGLDFTAKDGTEIDLLNFDKYLDEFDEGKIKTISSAIQNKLDEVTSILVKNGATNFTWSTLFGDDGFTIDNETEQAYVKNIGKFIQMYGDDVTSETWTAFARRFTQEGEKLNWQGLIEAIANMQDWETFTYGLTNEIQKNINDGLAKANIEGITIDGSSIKVEEGVDTTPIIEKIKAEYGKYGYTSIEVNADGGEIKVTVVDATIKTQIDASRSVLDNDGNPILNWQFMADETYQAQAQIDDIDVVFTVNGVGEVTYRTKNNKLINKNNVKEFLNNNGLNIDTVIEEGSFSNSATFNLVTAGGEETASTVSTINEDVRAIRTALENPIKIDVDDQASNKLDTIKESYNLLADTLEARPLVINTQGDSLSSAVTNKEGEKSGETDLPTLIQKISVIWEGLDDWKQDKELIQPVKISYVKNENWKRDLTQDIKINYLPGTLPSSSSNNDNNETSGEKKQGSVATGNVNLLKSGAAFARGTLMGELGPELYVQGGQYHIAGENGPEFVDLHPDAIVFNHLQTAGLLGKGHTTSTGSPVTSERRSVAFATGNVSGPAMASGLDDAIAAIDRAIAMWQNIANSTTQDLLNSSGSHKGGGSGNTLKAVTEELEEWYNLTRQIRDLEQEITNLQKERANIPEADGSAYLKSLREEQKLLREQMATQKALLDYQELQLQRQAEHINNNRIWSQFLTVGADGLLQYIEGNETNGGKGALQVLQELNQMSGEEQSAYLARLGYSYTNNDGEKLEGQELVEQFFQELQDQIDQYDSLYDTVHGTQETLEELQTSINDINDQIKENQMELEEEIFDIIVEALEKEIEVLQEQVDLIEEANEAYINGLNEALSAERQMYDDNQKVADREQLQRQLSLLRRSGGSASEIANLEEQLNDMLKDEYFNNQERMIEDIQKANDLQVQQLQTQIKLQEDSLEYQKEHGVIWNQVYQVLAQSKDEILAFMQGQKPEFFSQSLLQQEAMLTEWAHKIGIYSEDRKYQNFADHARNNLWDNGQAWNLGDIGKYQSIYNTLTDEEKNTIRDQFTSVYAQARLDGKDHTTAANEAAVAVSQTLKRKQDANNSQNNQAPTTNPNPQNPGGDNSGGSSSSSSGGSSSNENPNEMTHWKFTYNGKTYKHYKSQDSAISKMQALGREYLAANPGSMSKVREMFEAAKKTLKSGKHYAQGYSKGGLVDYTGVAIVHGSKTKPEGFLNAEQTAQIREGLKESGKGGALEGIKAALLKLDSSIKAVTNISNKTESNSYTIAPGAVVIQVEQLNDAYDVDTLSADIMNRMYAIGNKSTNRGVSRR